MKPTAETVHNETIAASATIVVMRIWPFRRVTGLLTTERR
jgi:hypothetical protein